MSERQVWAIQVVIEATPEQAEQAEEAIARALCPDEDHPGECETPWITMCCLLTDLDDDERAAWQDCFDEDRRGVREAGGIHD